MSKDFQNGIKLVWGVMIAGFLFFILINSCGNSAQHREAAIKRSAWIATETFVLQNLKAPATADFHAGGFQNPQEHVRALGKDSYRVSGYVDAQNSFGAQIRNHFVCEVRNIGGENWTCDSIIIY